MQLECTVLAIDLNISWLLLLHVSFAACPAGSEVTPGVTPPACRVCRAGSVSPGGLVTANPACTNCTRASGTTTWGSNRVTCNGAATKTWADRHGAMYMFDAKSFYKAVFYIHIAHPPIAGMVVNTQPPTPSMPVACMQRHSPSFCCCCCCCCCCCRYCCNNSLQPALLAARWYLASPHQPAGRAEQAPYPLVGWSPPTPPAPTALVAAQHGQATG
jgi:hypothetical protein